MINAFVWGGGCCSSPPERAVAVGTRAGSLCAGQGVVLLLSPSSAWFPKAFPYQPFSCWLQG